MKQKVQYQRFCYKIFNPKVIMHYEIINLPLLLLLLLCINYRSIGHYTDNFNQSINQLLGNIFIIMLILINIIAFEFRFGKNRDVKPGKISF